MSSFQCNYFHRDISALIEILRRSFFSEEILHNWGGILGLSVEKNFNLQKYYTYSDRGKNSASDEPICNDIYTTNNGFLSQKLFFGPSEYPQNVPLSPISFENKCDIRDQPGLYYHAIKKKNG
jgi:hypothetical protein